MISTPVYGFLRLIIWFLIILSTYVYPVTSRQKACEPEKHEIKERIRRLKACGIQPDSTLPPKSSRVQCYYSCKHRGFRKRSQARFSNEISPVLLTYPLDPNYVDDKRFCLVFDRFYWEVQNDVYYDVKIGSYSCRLIIWENNKPGRDIEVVKSTPKEEYYSRLSLHMVNEINRIEISTDAERLQGQSSIVSAFSDKNQRGQFPSEVADKMVTCVNVLEIEGTHKSPVGIFSSTDRCRHQQFRLSYPEECTSLPFTGGWKRGQTVTSAVWSIAVVDQPDQFACVDVDRAVVYSTTNEFTDRYINVAAQYLRPGLNRICNTFQFTATFGSEDNPEDYGPYDLKICGYIKVNDTPCLIMKPTDTGQLIRLPIEQQLVLNAEQTIEKRQNISDYQFDWSCKEKGSQNNICNNTAGNSPILNFKPTDALDRKEINLTLTITYKPGTFHETIVSESRSVFVVDENALQVTINCLSNCKPARVSIVQVVLRADCANCPDLDDLEYSWSVEERDSNQIPQVIMDDELLTLVTEGNVTSRIFSMNSAGNVLLERIFKICLTMKKKSKGYDGEACEDLDYKGAPLPSGDDRCIITPYNAQPGFLVWTYSGLCFWQTDVSQLYRVFTYDVGLSEREREYNLVAFSDISRLPDLQLPFGNPNHDYELGVIFYISNRDGQTYVYNMNEAFKKRDIVFRVRQPSDYSYLDKVLTITDTLQDREKSGQFGSRQGIMNTAALVAKVVFNDTAKMPSSLGKRKQNKIRENLISTLAPLASSDMNTVKQLTPIFDTLSGSEEDMTDEFEDKGAEALASLTEGLRDIAETDLSTAKKLSKQQHSIVERFMSRSVVHQKSVKDTDLSDEDVKKFVERASNYSKMYLNIAAGLAATTTLPDTPQVDVTKKSAIAVQWTEVKNDTVFNMTKDRSDQSSFGSSIVMGAAALNISEGTVVDVIMAVTKENLFAMGGGAGNVNMPMINFELKDRGSHESVAAPSLSTPVDVFIERTATADVEEEWQWERINLTEPIIPKKAKSTAQEPATTPSSDDISYKLLEKETSVTLNVSDTHAILLRFAVSDALLIIFISITYNRVNGTDIQLFQKQTFPRLLYTLKEVGNMRQQPDVFFLPKVSSDEVGGSYEVSVSVISPDETVFKKDKAPYLNMLRAMVACQTWNTTSAAWEASGCEVTDLSNFEVLHCQCRHLSVFSGGILVNPRPVDIFDAALFKEFFNNPAVVSVVVFIWLLYFILVYWAKDEDWLDSYRSRVAVLEDNQLTDKWAYLVCCVTGWWINSGTTASVFIYLKGTRGFSRVHRLTDDEQDLFVKGAENWFILTTPKCLGKIKSVVLWHDSSGLSPAWFVKEVYVEDINRGEKWHCLYDDWISVEHGDGDLCVEIPAMSPEEIHQRRLYQMVLKTSLSLRNSHIWISIALKPCYSSFTRVQRVTCALCVLLTTMLSNIMFFGVPVADGKSQVSKEPLRLNFRSIIIGIEVALVVFPINVLLVQLFTRTSRRPTRRQYQSFGLEDVRFLKQDLSLEESEEIFLDESEIISISEDADTSVDPDEHIALEYEETLSMAEEGRSGRRTSTRDSYMKANTSGKDEYGRSVHESDAFFTEGDAVEHQSRGKADQYLYTDPAVNSITNEVKGSSATSDSLGSTGLTSKFWESGVRQNSNNSANQSGVRQNSNNSASQSGVRQNSNNSASQSGIDRTSPKTVKKRDIPKFARRVGSCRLSQHTYESGQLTDQLRFMTETTWFQNAMIFLRKNVVRLVEDSRNRDTSLSQKTTSRPARQEKKASSESAFLPLSYFEKLKARQHGREDRRAESVEKKANAETETNLKTKLVVGEEATVDSNTGAGASAAKMSNEARSSMKATASAYTSFAEKHAPQRRKQQDNNSLSAPEATQGSAPHVENYLDIGSRGDCLRQNGSYLDKLKEKRGRQLKTNTEKKIVVSSSHTGRGDWEMPMENRASSLCQPTAGSKPVELFSNRPQIIPSFVEKNKVRSNAGRQPQACWFCSKVPGQTEPARHLQTVPAGKSEPRSRGVPKDKLKNSSKSFKTKLKKLIFKSPKREAEKKPLVNDEDPAGNIPFDTILRYHDYEYEHFQKRGSKALKSFRRRAAQCIAEEYLNSNDNAKSNFDDLNKNYTEEFGYGGTENFDDPNAYDDLETTSVAATSPGHPCALCMEVTFRRFVSTLLCVFFCQCPRGTKIPWWTIYFTWTLAIFVAVSSSWVVMLYGLRLGYQGSVDWLSCFFAGFCQNVLFLQPIKVMIVSLTYIVLLKQHVSVREETGISVHDENNELVYMKMLREYEARRRLLEGMWTTMDYEYPIPRSKAKDIKLRLEQDAKARMILRESMIWIVFLIVVAIVCRGHTSVENAYNTNVVIKNMLEEGIYGDLSLEDIGETDDIWDYMADTLLPTVFAEPNKTTASGASVLLGSIRFRQIRQKPDNTWCKGAVSHAYEHLLKKSYCLPSFNALFQDTGSFNFSWKSPIASQRVNKTDRIAVAWVYRSSIELREHATWGQTAVYPGGGHAISLPDTPTESSDTVNTLRRMNWIDKFTRAVIIEMNLYTPSHDLISSVSVLCEKEPDGEIISRLFQHTVKLHMYSEEKEKTITYAEMGWILMLSINMYYEMQEIISLGLVGYLQSGWTYLELINFFLSMAAVGTHLARIITVDNFLDQLAADHFKNYVSFAVPRAMDQALDVLKSLVFAMVVLKVFRVLRFNRYFRVLLQSFTIARESLINQTFVCFIVFMAFSSVCYLLFVTSLEDYRSLPATLAALFDFGLGNGDFFGYQEAHPVLGPLLYFSFFLSFTVITMSFFVTFILESFNVARAFVQLNADEQHVLRYVKRMFRLLIGATPTIKQVRRQRRTHPFKPASFSSSNPPV